MWPWTTRAERGAGAANVARWVVLDVESTGLDPRRDRLLAIAAVAVHWHGTPPRPQVMPGDSFAAVLRGGDAATTPAAGPDRANILLHGIGLAAQRAGAEPADVHRAFDAWCAGAPRLGYHVAFDRALIERSRHAVLGEAAPAPAPRWLDLEPIAAVAAVAGAAPAGARAVATERALDDWLERFGITCLARHDAAADALATAELLLALWPRLARETGTVRDAAAAFAALERIAAARRWLPR